MFLKHMCTQTVIRGITSFYCSRFGV